MTARERSIGGERRRRRQVPAKKPRVLARRVGPVPVWGVLVAAVAVVAVVGIAAANSLSGRDPALSGSGSAPSLPYAVGDPGVGAPAPDFELANASGGPFKLSERRGKEVLLFFHEGLMCAPCWKQVDDVQADLAKFTALGIDEVAAISIDPLAAQQQRAATRGISIAVLADADRAVSAEYDALSYGMMGGSTPGHTFILVGADGVIRWRADYGGPPDFTMYVPNGTLLAELRKVLGTS